MTSFGSRVRQARRHAGLSQPKLARGLGVKQQTIQYLESPKANARGSKYTNAIANACGVDPTWLASGEGLMLKRAPPGVHEPGANYETLTDDAREIARIWARLSPDAQNLMRDMLFVLRFAEGRYPWLRRGRPKGETYVQWEKRMAQNFAALQVLTANREKPV